MGAWQDCSTVKLAYTFAHSAIAGCKRMPGSAGPLPGTLLIGMPSRKTREPAGASPGANGSQG
eukprot:2533849-Alexandrium_andersonii.AAC.1